MGDGDDAVSTEIAEIRRELQTNPRARRACRTATL